MPATGTGGLLASRILFRSRSPPLISKHISTRRQNVPELRGPDQGIRGRGLPNEEGRERGRRRATAGERTSFFSFFPSFFFFSFFRFQPSRALVAAALDSFLSNGGE